MEEVKNTRIEINLNDGSIMIAGREEFVEKNMNVIFEFVEKNVHFDIKDKKVTGVKPNETESGHEQKDTNLEDSEPTKQGDDKYVRAGVYHIDAEDGTISILKKIPGNSKSEKMRNIALIVLFIRKEKILGKAIIPICEKHSCYDAGHFAAVFEAEKTNIIRRGKGKNWTIELTQPGEEAAIALLEEMANDKK